MATKQGKNKNQLIQCENCGEYYSVTYKRCPFCEEYEDGYGDEYEDAPRRSTGGKRLVSNTRGGGYGRGWTPVRIFITVLSIAIMIAAFCIVFTLVKPLIDRGKVDPGQISPSPAAVSPSAGPSSPAEPSPSAEPPVSPSPSPSQIPSTQTATGFSLNKSEFTLNDRYPDPITLKVTFTPSGSTGFITWTSSDPDIASVDENGKVSHGTKTGTATITATMAGGVTHTCKVYNRVTGSAPAVSTPSPTSSGTAASSLSLNKTDFTFSSPDEPAVQMRVNGTSSTPVWSIKNTAVATISADGVVRPVARGTTTITCTVDGQTLECIVRVTFD